LFLIAGRLLDPVTMYPLACFPAWPHGATGSRLPRRVPGLDGWHQASV